MLEPTLLWRISPAPSISSVWEDGKTRGMLLWEPLRKTNFPASAYPNPLPGYMVELINKLKWLYTNFSLRSYLCMPTLHCDGTIAAPQFSGIEAVDSSSDITNVTSGATHTYEFVSQICPVDIVTW